MGVLYLYFDLETTGLSKWVDRIVQIGMMAVLKKNDSQTTILEFETLVNPDKQINPSASIKTGIYNKDLINAPKTKDALLNLFEKIKHLKKQNPSVPVYLVAYNGIQFDFPMLICELIRYNMIYILSLTQYGVDGFLDPLLWARDSLDTTCLIRRSNGTCSYTLSDVYIALHGTKMDNAHTALADTQGLKSICSHKTFGSMIINTTKSRYYIPASEYVKDILNRKTEFENSKNNNKKRKLRSLMYCSKVLKKRTLEKTKAN